MNQAINPEDTRALNRLRLVWSEFYTVRFDGNEWTALHHKARPWARPISGQTWTGLQERLENDYAEREAKAARRRRG